MKRPFEAVKELVYGTIAKSAENDKRNFEFLHTFTIWLMGFSIGALYLIASNFVNLKEILSYWTIKSIILTLGLSVISGILHRIFLFSYQVRYDNAQFYVEGAFSDIQLMNQNPEDVSSEENIQTLVNLLLNDYDIDERYVLPIYATASDGDKKLLIEMLKKKYTDIGAWAKRDYEIIFNHINTTLKNAYGVNDKEILNASEVSGAKIRKLRIAYTLSLYVCCGSFIISLLILALAY